MTRSGSVTATVLTWWLSMLSKRTHKGLANGKRLVAKIYDPLYFFDDNGYFDPFLCVESRYVNESATYLRLSDLQGTWIPEYYGSFSLQFAVQGTSTKRCVRLILIGFIPGHSMREMEPKSLSQYDRQGIMKRLIDFDTMLYSRNIVYVDKHPRIIILTTPELRQPKHRRIVFIDFGCVRFRRNCAYPPDAEIESKMFAGTCVSPLLRWHKTVPGSFMADFFEWIDWDWQPWLETECASTAGWIFDEMRDKFLPKWLIQPPEDLPF